MLDFFLLWGYVKDDMYSTCVSDLDTLRRITNTVVEMTEAFTAGVMIFIEQFRARWPWSIGV